ncbi:hypothetical protein HELRODRAFT_165361 [Helobdella robusta]|uniref:Uncharacterized protein n=1 Tax=Helobdella robusta TaxID=6412 RepID=T1EWN0_HELRO|nr:hypothetical protein HELRODRAFT_165361 [Helobdella robusta]ESN91339.1 hypothetical protein HELRODRAFT_165361 [Helobdella robusta]
MSNEHHMPLTRTILDSNITILDSVLNTGRLKIREALYINKYKPTLNKQYNILHTLQLFSQYRELIPTIAVENKPADVSVPTRYEYRSKSDNFRPVNTQFLTSRPKSMVITSLATLFNNC